MYCGRSATYRSSTLYHATHSVEVLAGLLRHSRWLLVRAMDEQGLVTIRSDLLLISNAEQEV